MATNPFFHPPTYGTSGEQGLLDDLIVESIQIHGMDIAYIPRVDVDPDPVYQEATQVRFEEALPVEVYLKSFDSFQGDGHFMSNLGVEVRDAVTFTVANTRFQAEVGQARGWSRPREGDLIYYPFNGKCFEIKWVDKFVMHYPLGTLYTYDMRCEVFEYTGQVFATGNALIDAVQGDLSLDVIYRSIQTEDGMALKTEDGFFLMPEDHDEFEIDPLDDALDIQTEADTFIDFSERDVWSEGTY